MNDKALVAASIAVHSPFYIDPMVKTAIAVYMKTLAEQRDEIESLVGVYQDQVNSCKTWYTGMSAVIREIGKRACNEYSENKS